jgi:hypothetical protein
MQKRTTKAISLLLAFSLTCPMAFASAAADAEADIQGTKDYTIISPYEEVDWDTWGPTKRIYIPTQRPVTETMKFLK